MLTQEDMRAIGTFMGEVEMTLKYATVGIWLAALALVAIAVKLWI